MTCFEKHQLYYCILFDDKELKQPVITTLQFIEKRESKDKIKWVFSEVGVSDDNQERRCSFDRSTIETVLTINDLMEELKSEE